MPIDQPAPLTKRSAAHGELLLEDRPCPTCSYNLRGLPIGGACPECATPITRLAPRVRADELLNMPSPYIRLGQLAFTLMTFGLLAPLGMIGIAFYSMATGLGATATNVLLMATLTVGALLWASGVAYLCAPRPAPPRKGARRDRMLGLRLLVAIGAVCLIAGAVVGVVAGGTAAPGASVIWTVCAGFLYVGGFGLAPAAWLLANFASWANDLDRAVRLRVTAVGVLIVAILFAVGFRLGLPLPTFAFGMGVLVVEIRHLAAFAALLALLWNVSRLSGICGWTLTNQRRERRRIAELQEQTRCEAAAAREELDWNEPFGGPLQP